MSKSHSTIIEHPNLNRRVALLSTAPEYFTSSVFSEKAECTENGSSDSDERAIRSIWEPTSNDYDLDNDAGEAGLFLYISLFEIFYVEFIFF